MNRAHQSVVPAAPPTRFLILEVARGIAASMVALSHATSLVAEPRYFGAITFGGRLANMNVGVDFFFVLSGFIITFVHWEDFGRPQRLPRYISRRFTRVLPPYWVILTVIVAVYLAVPSFGEPRQHDGLYVLTSYVLFPMPEQPVLGVAWTLTYELFFYVLLGLVIRYGRRALPIFALWAAGIAVCQVLGLTRYPMSFLGSPYGLQFLMGMGLAAWLRNRQAILPAALFGAGIAGFFAAVFLAPEIQTIGHGLAARLVFGGAASLIIAGGVELERSGRLHVPRVLLPIGAASYAIYLSHVVSESALIRASFHGAPAAIGPNALVLLLALAGVGGGILYHYAVERPLTAAVRRRLP